MSVEAMTIASLVEEGTGALRTLYASGITEQDFPVYEDEFVWVTKRLARKKPVNRRVFRAKFPDFEWMKPVDSVRDLAAELKEERAFDEANALLATLSEKLERDNAIELLLEARERISTVTRAFAPVSDVRIEDWREHIDEMRRWRQLAAAGTPMGVKTGFAHLDHHLGGLLPGQMVQILGRTGEGKSGKMMVMALNAKLQGTRVGFFSPEHSQHEVRCRLHTYASARPEIQAALGLERSFRNRALLFRRNFNLKAYQRFCVYFDEELPGEIHLLAGRAGSDQMGIGYIEDRIAELGLDVVFVDPIYLLKPVRRYRDNSQAEIGSTAYALNALSENYQVPIVFSNQANRQGVQGDAPHKDKAYNSDVPNHTADYVIGVKHMSEDNTMKCRCTKSRFGQDGFRYDLRIFPNTGFIRELTPIKGDYYNGADEEASEDEVRRAVETAQQ